MRERPITSKKYELTAYRYRELKNYCLQYPEWIDRRKDILLSISGPGSDGMPHGSGTSDKTGKQAVMLAMVQEKIDLVENAALKACKPHMMKVIIDAVTHGETYNDRYSKVCSRREFYAERRRFFFALHCMKK